MKITVYENYDLNSRQTYFSEFPASGNYGTSCENKYELEFDDNEVKLERSLTGELIFFVDNEKFGNLFFDQLKMLKDGTISLGLPTPYGNQYLKPVSQVEI